MLETASTVKKTEAVSAKIFICHHECDYRFDLFFHGFETFLLGSVLKQSRWREGILPPDTAPVGPQRGIVSRAAFSLEQAQWGLIHVDRYLKGGCTGARAGLCSAGPIYGKDVPPAQGRGQPGTARAAGSATPRLVPGRSQCLGTRARPGDAGACGHHPLIQASG